MVCGKRNKRKDARKISRRLFSLFFVVAIFSPFSVRYRGGYGIVITLVTTRVTCTLTPTREYRQRLATKSVAILSLLASLLCFNTQLRTQLFIRFKLDFSAEESLGKNLLSE